VKGKAHTEGLVIRPAGAGDLEALVDLHLAFAEGSPVPEDELPSRAFYRDKMRLFFEADPEGVLVAEREGKVIGGLVVVTQRAGLAQTALRHGFALRAAARTLVGGYGAAGRKLVLAAGSLFRRRAGAEEGAEAKVWVLLVHPEHRRRGVAGALLRAAEGYVRGRGVRELTVTVTEDNRAARALYEEAGFVEAGRCLESSGPSLILTKQIDGKQVVRVSASRPVRVALVITRLVPGGAQRVVWSLLEGLGTTRYRVILVCGPEGLHLPGGHAASSVVVARHLRRDVSPVDDVLALAELTNIFRSFGTELVHTHTSKAGVLGRLAARLARVRAVVHTPHGHIYAPEANIQSVPRHRLLRAGLLWSERWAGRWTTLLTTLTEAEARETVALGLASAGRVLTVPNGVEVEEFSHRPPAETLRRLRRELGIPARAQVVISVGRLSPVKGHRVLVEALALPAGQAPHLLLVGEGPERPALGALARRLGVCDRVHFAGRRERGEVAALLHLAQVFVLPSYYEGFGLALLEAQAAGLAVVATDVGGVREVLAGGRTGLLVPLGDPEALAEAVGRVLTDRALAGRLAREGRQRVVQEFPVERMVERYRAVYRRALELTQEDR